MPPKKSRRMKSPRPVSAQGQEQEREQPGDPRLSPPPEHQERAAAADPVPKVEPAPQAEEDEEDAPVWRSAVAPWVVTHFSDDNEDAPARRTVRAAPRVVSNFWEDDEDAPARKRAAAQRTVTNFSEDEKEVIIDFLKRHPTLYSKRLAGYKDAAGKESLWLEQATRMQCAPGELKTWYDSMRTKLGKLKKAVSQSGQAADRFTATEGWLWRRFHFLLEHITPLPRRPVATFTLTPRTEPAVDAAGAPPAAPAPEPPEDGSPPPPPPPPPAGVASSALTSSTAGANPEAKEKNMLMGLLETFLSERQSVTHPAPPAHPAAAFGSYVVGSLRSLPPAIRRTAEARILGVLHECHDVADRQQSCTSART